ncbi:MAG: hypothetical protein OXQ94_01565 [Gemmatimonadota bacterium]|nr:hypothetical protein [Gemmatimonadota bacterium]MDE2870367.1 hypothetical protein [Gemmatimonadota bacterium]
MSEETGTDLPAQASPGGQLELWGEMLSVERERIASRDRAVEAMREGFAKLDAADERQFKFHIDRLRRDDEFRNRRLTHVIRLTWVGVAVAIGVLGIVLAMLFWGGEEQRATAILLTTHALSAGAFFAVGFLLGRRSRG